MMVLFGELIFQSSSLGGDSPRYLLGLRSLSRPLFSRYSSLPRLRLRLLLLSLRDQDLDLDLDRDRSRLDFFLLSRLLSLLFLLSVS